MTALPRDPKVRASKRPVSKDGSGHQHRPARAACEPLERRVLLTAVTGYHNDPGSTGQNLAETELTPANVNALDFQRLSSTPVDGQVYAQPLYVPGVKVTAGSQPGTHDVVYVATEHGSLYAIDGDSGAVLWNDSFLVPDPELQGPGSSVVVSPIPETDVIAEGVNIGPEIGITSTPAIDPATGFLFLTASTKQVVNGDVAHPHYVYTIYRVNIADGTYAGSVMGDTVFNPDGTYTYRESDDPYVLGTGDGNIAVGGQQRVYFNAMRELNRPALTLAHGSVYVAFASHGDYGPYHGWVLGYDENTLGLTAVWNATPNGGLGGIWQSGGSLAVDPQGYLYFETGNGTFDTTFDASGFPINGNYGDSFVKLMLDPTTAPNPQNLNGWGLRVVDYFTPFNQQYLQDVDLDLGSGGVMILPDSVGNADHPHLLVGNGKEGKIYLIDRDSMGKFDPNTDRVVEDAQATGASFDTPAFLFDGTEARIYYVGAGDEGRAFVIADGAFSPVPESQTPDVYYGWQGSTPSISADGTSNGIVWDIDRTAGVLRAYDATNYADELYSSDQAAGGRDALGTAIKFSVPTVADGHVFVGTQAALMIFGHPPAPSAPPSNLAASAQPDQVALQWDPVPGAAYYNVYRSTDGVDFQSIATRLTTTGFLDRSALPGVPYYYQVTAASGGGETHPSDAAAATATLAGDANGDGAVDFSDLLVVAQNFGARVEPTVAAGDLNQDGAVNFADLLILAQNFGRKIEPIGSESQPDLPSVVDLAARKSRP